MISLCGTVWGRRYGSFLYAIFSDEHVYFGETGDMPSARWGQHLGHADSSFAEKLQTSLNGQPAYKGDIVFIGIYCDVIDEIEDSRRRIARRAVEEELHRQFLLNKNSLPTERELLSTPPPAPIRQKFPFPVEAIAKQAFELIVSQYLSWLTAKKPHP